MAENFPKIPNSSYKKSPISNFFKICPVVQALILTDTTSTSGFCFLTFKELFTTYCLCKRLPHVWLMQSEISILHTLTSRNSKLCSHSVFMFCMSLTVNSNYFPSINLICLFLHNADLLFSVRQEINFLILFT
jgi:hypothetical protein